MMRVMSSGNWDMAILQFLDEDWAFATGTIAGVAWTEHSRNNRIRSAWTRNSLLRLEAFGYVRRLDDQKPDTWVRTQEGTRVMEFSRDMARHDGVPT